MYEGWGPGCSIEEEVDSAVGVGAGAISTDLVAGIPILTFQSLGTSF